MKKSIRVLITLVLLMLIAPTVSAGSMNNFQKTQSYIAGQYHDVASNAWYVSGVSSAYELGLMKGNSATVFNPDGNLTVAESLAIACRLHSIYSGNGDNFVQDSPWYQVYVDYAVANGIMSAGQLNPKNAITREQFAYIMCGALPSSELRKINTVNSLPDVLKNSTYGGFVYRLYEAGILTGNDQYGTFNPTSNIRRSEVATIITRLAIESQRKTLSLEKATSSGTTLSAKEIAQKCSSAVFYIESYAVNGAPFASGSGFFISKDGLAVTNAHVFANVYNAMIQTSDGQTYEDVKLVALDEANDVALLRVSGNSFPYLTVDSSFKPTQGDTVYAIGSPHGWDNTLSEGIISNPGRLLDGINYIQTSAPTAPGSSGGALINEYGNVIGITSAGIEGSGNINLSIPISQITHLDASATTQLLYFDETVYPDFTDAIDFGAMSGVKLLNSWRTVLGYKLEYDMMDYYDAFGESAGTRYGVSLAYFEELLEGRGFKLTASDSNSKTFETDDEYVCYELDYTNRIITIWAERQFSFYKEIPSLPDLGRTLKIGESTPTMIDGSITYQYYWTSYYDYSTFYSALDAYFDLIERCGFQCTYSLAGDSPSYVFEGNGWSVVFLCLNNRSIFVDAKPV